MNTPAVNVFTYQWQYDDENINVFGLDKENRTVYIKIIGFTPYVYLELPDVPNVKWADKVSAVVEKLSFGLRNKPIAHKLMYKRKLYYAHKNADGSDKLFPFLCLSFKSKSHAQQLRWLRPQSIPGIGQNLVFKVHESDASPVLQMTCIRGVAPVGWLSILGSKVKESEKESICDTEYRVHWKYVSPSACTASVDPLVMSFDIECNSSNPNRMPDASKPGDKVFQISVSLTTKTSARTFLLTLGAPDQQIVGDSTEIIAYATEHELLCGYASFIALHKPQIVVGYNIFMFDIPYMINRAKHTMCLSSFDRQGYIIGQHAPHRKITWSSAAMKDQQFEFLDVPGALFVDLLPIVKRDYKLDNYKLKTVSEYFLKGCTKDPLTPQDIFKCYDTFTPKSLGVVGKYCVQDSVIVSQLCSVMQVWVGLCEMATTCNVPIFSLYTQGQQLKVYAQVYKYCLGEGIVVEKNENVCSSTYTGAYVVDPVAGVYDNVVPFDFASLYPTTIIAYNIDYSTMVLDESIPDSKCHVIEWEDHVGCAHDNHKKVEKIVCEKHRFRFLRDGLGVIPTIIQRLLDARKQVNVQLKKLKHDNASKEQIDVLDKRQLSYKISANSMYGALGVQRGYLPFMPAAMCTTALGRKSIVAAAKFIQDTYNGQLVYGDTDSTMIMFPHVTDPARLWGLCEQIERDVATLFPSPMRLAFEEKIYKRFFILTKKRYIALECGEDGVFTGKVTKKGILLARRDNSRAVRDVYEKTIMHVLHNTAPDIDGLVESVNSMFQRAYATAEFVITKSVGDVAGYKQKELPSDEKKRHKRLRDLNCTETDFAAKCLPAHVQLAERMRQRGARVDVGSRLEYVITTNGDKLMDKLEDINYFVKFGDLLRIDYTYYLRLLINPIDQIINATTHKPADKNLIAVLYKTHVNKERTVEELKQLSSPTIYQL
jgi:DNA polymerase elongation subunit (family B)